jgi:hypothetical protein
VCIFGCTYSMVSGVSESLDLQGSENYYTDKRVLHALEKSSEELMDILTFVKEIHLEIKDNLGFDVLWDSMVGPRSGIVVRRCSNVAASLLEWMGYEGSYKIMKQTFVRLLESNDIEYQEIGFEDPLIEKFPEIQEEINQMRVIDKPRKRWLIMNTKNFKEAIIPRFASS